MPDEPAQAVELLTTRQLAMRLQIDIKTLRALTKEGRIPSIKITPKIVRYDPAAVLEVLVRNSEAGHYPAARPHPLLKGKQE